MGKVDPNEAPPGYMAAEESYGCNGCAFHYSEADCLSAFCSSSDRKDGCRVIFVDRTGKATASWPYDSEGTPVEVEA